MEKPSDKIKEIANKLFEANPQTLQALRDLQYERDEHKATDTEITLLVVMIQAVLDYLDEKEKSNET